MCFLPLQQDFYSKSCHASPQNSSHIYAYGMSLRENFTTDVSLDKEVPSRFLEVIRIWSPIPDRDFGYGLRIWTSLP